MNILYIAHRIPFPPNKGDKIRSFHQIQALSKRHSVHVMCLIDDREDVQHVSSLRKHCASVVAVCRSKGTAKLLALAALPTGKPLSVAAFYSHELQEKIRQKIRTGSIDLIMVYSSAMAEYIREVADIPKVMDFVDVDSAKWEHYADFQPILAASIYRLEGRRLRRYEADIAPLFDHAFFVSDAEARLFQARVESCAITAIPNGVDLDYFSPAPNGLLRISEPVVVFTGMMDYFPNIDAVTYFCEHIFPLVQSGIPAARFLIVGRNPTRRVRALGNLPNVIVTGAVPDVRPYLAQASIAVAPFRIARGIQNKVLEAMAMGVPVVATPVALQGMTATEADGVRSASEPCSFAQSILTLFTDQDLRLRCSQQARAYVCGAHRWESHGAQLEAVLQRLK